MIRRLLLALVATAAPATALAGRCDPYVALASKSKGDTLVRAFRDLAACDKAVAKAEFPRFMVAADDLETLVPLTLAAVDADAWNAVWEMMERVPWEHRTDLATAVGEACATQPKVVSFLQGAHAGLKGSEFMSWTPALAACTRPELRDWMASVIAAPPASAYNEKYDAVVDAWIEVQGKAAVPALEAAAIKAGAAGGSVVTLLDAMKEAYEPGGVRAAISPEDEAALQDAYVRVAKAVPPTAARQVADKLYTAGAEGRAAALLPSIYPDRVQPGGQVAWAAAAIEQCDGEAVVHWLAWTEAPTRLDVLTPATAPLRASKPGLKCTSTEPWPVRATTEPLTSLDDAGAWVESLLGELSGVKAKAREEKKVAVP
jgi:hypothetical protein